MKLKTLAVAIAAIAVSGAANADWEVTDKNYDTASGGGGQTELILTVWNPDAAGGAGAAFSQDLGYGALEFMDGSHGNDIFALSQDGLDHIEYSPSATIYWNVAGANTDVNETNYDNFETYGAYYTSNVAPNVADKYLSEVEASIAGFQNYKDFLDANATLAADGTSENPVFLTTAFDAGDDQNWGSVMFKNESYWTLDGTAMDGESIMAWSVGISSDDYTSAVTSADTLTWTLNASTGQLIYGSAVPVPAAAWLFGSALLGLAGAARRRKVQA